MEFFYPTYIRAGQKELVLTGKEAKKAIKKVQRNINSRFDKGQPFFTKDALRDVRDQLRRSHERGDKITVKGLDGVPVDFILSTGTIFPYYNYDDIYEDDPAYDELEHVLMGPHIDYQALHMLTKYPEPIIKVPLAYCSVRIAHEAVLREKKTGKILTGNDATPESSKRDAKRFFEQNLRTWNEGQQSRSFVSILKSRQDYFKNGGVSNIISFGSGTFTGKVNSNWKNRASFQHASLLTLREFLREALGDTDDTQILAQDPAYTQVDKDILKEQGITTVDDPDGFLELDNRSIVFSCAPTAPIKQIVMDLCRPLVLISDTVVSKDQSELVFSNEDSSRIRDLIKNHYDIFDFPQDPDNLGHRDKFGHVSIYIRRPEN